MNDAPLATLTGSTSIAEIKCHRKVMGVKMTEEIRKLCHFFLKKHPSHIKDLWYPKPAPKAYHEKEFGCVIGGTVSSVGDILDRILVVNSLIDTCKDIYLGGQFGLAALHALGVKVGHIDNAGDFDQTTEFFNTLFVKSVEKKARLHFPTDFLLAVPEDMEKSKQEQMEYEAQLQQQIQATNRSKAKSTGGADSALNQSQQDIESMKQIRHWFDRMIVTGKTREAKIGHLVSEAWNNHVLKKAFESLVSKGVIEEGQEFSLENPLLADSVIHNTVEEAEAGEAVKPNEIVVEFSSHTRQTLCDMANVTFKLLWDGSLSPLSAHYPDSAQANLSTKLFTETLFDLRVASQNDDEP